MQNFPGTCLALAILAGGFVVTGDLVWLAGRGLRVVRATDVPTAAAESAAEVPAPVAPAASPSVAAVPRRPPAGPARVDIDATRPGQRILVWRDAAAEPLAIDVVDPATAAVLLHDGPPRRALIVGGAVVRGVPLRVVGIGLARGREAAPAAESLGDVTGIAPVPAGR